MSQKMNMNNVQAFFHGKFSGAIFMVNVGVLWPDDSRQLIQGVVLDSLCKLIPYE